MIISKIECDNLFLFKDFKIDLSYNKKVKNYLSVNDALSVNPKIYIRKNIVVMGGNASGKTTFGKLLCLICNYLKVSNINSIDGFNMPNAIYNKKDSAYFAVEFIINNTIYYLKAEFDIFGLTSEEIRRYKIYPSYNMTQLRKMLYGVQNKNVGFYNRNTSIQSLTQEFSSYLLKQEEYLSYTKDIIQDDAFMFRFSDLFDSSSEEIGQEYVDIDLISSMLPSIDSSVESVEKLISKKNPNNKTYAVNFKNGDTLTVPDAMLSACKYDRLSRGTFEAIDYASTLSIMRKSKKSTLFYVDELLTHIHTDLECYLIRLSFLLKNKDSQVFFTTHNTDILDLNIAPNSFLFFKRNSDGFNEAFFASDYINKNDRTIKHYYENDYFDVAPDIDSIGEIFE